MFLTTSNQKREMLGHTKLQTVKNQITWPFITKSVFPCSKSSMNTIEQRVKSVQS